MNTTDDAAVKLLLTRAKEGNKGAMDQLASLCQLTHDGFGRRLSTPTDGGLVPGILNLTIGETKACDPPFLVSLQKDDLTRDLFVSFDPRPALTAFTSSWQPYNSCQAYFRWYEPFIKDGDFDMVVNELLTILPTAVTE